MKTLLTLGIILSLAAPAHGADIPKGGPVYTNNDLNRYRHPDDPPPPSGPPVVVREKPDTNKVKAEKEKMQWCSKSTHFKDKVERAKAKVDEADSELRGIRSDQLQQHYKRKTDKAQKKLDKAEKELRRAEKSRDEFERQAAQQGVPPGWLRCQF